MRKEPALQNRDLTEEVADPADPAVLGTKLIGFLGQAPFQILPNGLVSHMIGTRGILAERLSGKNIIRLI